MDRYFSNMTPAASALLKEWALPRSTPSADHAWLAAHPSVVSKESIDALTLCADFLRTRRMVAQSFFFRWKAHILKLCMQTSIDSFFSSLSLDGEVERVMRQIGGPEAQHMAEIIAGIGVEKSGSLSAQIDDDGVTHDVKRREAAEHNAATRTPVEQWLKLRDEWQAKWRADFQSQVMALASDEALVRTQVAALMADSTRRAAMEAKAHAAYADVEKCEQAKAAVRHRLAPTVIGLFDLVMPEFTENGVLEWNDLVRLAAEGKDVKDDDVTYQRVRATARPAVQSLNELTAEIAKHCYHVPATLHLLSSSDADLFIPILRHFRIQAIALFAAAYLSLIGVELTAVTKP